MVSISPFVHYLPHTLDGILSKLSNSKDCWTWFHKTLDEPLLISLFHCIFPHEVRPV